MGIYSMGSITPRMLIQMDKKMADEQDTVIASGGIWGIWFLTHLTIRSFFAGPCITDFKTCKKHGSIIRPLLLKTPIS